MKRFQKILVYVNPEHQGADTALERAARLARNNDGEITLATVIQKSDLMQNDAPVFKLDLRAVIKEHLLSRLEILAKPLRDNGLRVSTKLLIGKPVVALIREAVDGDYHLVMKTASPGEDSSLYFGSVANRLMRQCPCPVWIAQPEHDTAVKRVLAAVNPSSDPSNNALSTKVLELAHSIAEKEGADLYALHVWSAYGERLLKNHLTRADLQEYVDTHKHEAKLRFNHFVSATLPEGVRAHTHLLKGDAALVIPRFADEESMDLVVMGSVGRDGLNGLLMGNIAEKAIRRVHCSLLTVKPDGFASPIELAKRKR